MTWNIQCPGLTKFFSCNVMTLRKYAMQCTTEIHIIWTDRETRISGRLFRRVNNYSPLNGPSNFCRLNHSRISGISLGPSLSLHSLASPGTFAALVAFLSVYSSETSRTHRSHHSGCSRNTWNSSWTCRRQKKQDKTCVSLFGVVAGCESIKVCRKLRLTEFNWRIILVQELGGTRLAAHSVLYCMKLLYGRKFECLADGCVTLWKVQRIFQVPIIFHGNSGRLDSPLISGSLHSLSVKLPFCWEATIICVIHMLRNEIKRN